jgi:transcriptional regulator with XRE-family HTH domain
VSDQRVGAAFRAVRLRRGWRQSDVAVAVGVAEGLISALENGRLGQASLASIRKVGAAFDMEIEVRARWRGGELDRLINTRHNQLAVAVSEYLTALGWLVDPEVSFSYFGERGVVDLLAWHPATATLLVVEIKTEIVDPQELLGTFDKKRRLAGRIARDRGLQPKSVSAWLVVAEGSTNRKHVSRFASLLRASLPADGKTMAAWLAAPHGSVAGISFFSNLSEDGLTQSFSSRRRVRARKSEVGTKV